MPKTIKLLKYRTNEDKSILYGLDLDNNRVILKNIKILSVKEKHIVNMVGFIPTSIGFPEEYEIEYEQN